MGLLFGILGGMGPLAGAALLRRLIEVTPAATDRDHLPLLVHSVPEIPDRSAAICGGGSSPVEAMLAGIAVLRNAGVAEIAIACNTAHYWYDDLLQRGRVPIVHIADAVAARLDQRGLQGGRIGLIATEGTIRAGFYRRKLADRGYGDLLLPSDAEFAHSVSPGIASIKAGALEKGQGLLTAAAGALMARGADAVILGCTEVGLVLHDDGDGPYIDSTDALARLCHARWSARKSGHTSRSGHMNRGGIGAGL